jgi:hypothetical protein
MSGSQLILRAVSGGSVQLGVHQSGNDQASVVICDELTLPIVRPR